MATKQEERQETVFCIPCDLRESLDVSTSRPIGALSRSRKEFLRTSAKTLSRELYIPKGGGEGES